MEASGEPVLPSRFGRGEPDEDVGRGVRARAEGYLREVEEAEAGERIEVSALPGAAPDAPDARLQASLGGQASYLGAGNERS